MTKKISKFECGKICTVLDYLVGKEHFVQILQIFLRSFCELRNFAQIIAITKIFVQEINFCQRQNFLAWVRYVLSTSHVPYLTPYF